MSLAAIACGGGGSSAAQLTTNTAATAASNTATAPTNNTTPETQSWDPRRVSPRVANTSQADVNAVLDHIFTDQAVPSVLVSKNGLTIGVAGEFKYGLNETAIGMSFPPFGLQMAICRLSKRHQTQAVLQATLYGPEDAQTVGYLDEVVA